MTIETARSGTIPPHAGSLPSDRPPSRVPLCFYRRGVDPLPDTAAGSSVASAAVSSGASPTGSGVLPPASAAALVTLLPVLGCGEEAASLAFAAMASHRRLDPSAATALNGIAADEDWHDARIRDLLAALPAPADDSAAAQRDAAARLDATRAMHVGLGRAGVTARLARIAGLDSAVCLILARVLKSLPRTGITTAILTRIHADEARHVAITGAIAAMLAPAARLADEAAHARTLLAGIIPGLGPAFDTLAVDPDRLGRDLHRLPAGLFRA